jgi:hypothetical protein
MFTREEVTGSSGSIIWTVELFKVSVLGSQSRPHGPLMVVTLSSLVLDRTKAQPLINPQTGEYNDPAAPTPIVDEYDPDPKGALHSTVRDVSWNGNEPSMISTAWEGHSGGNIAVHSWKGLGKGGLNRLEDWVEVAVANGAEGVGDDGRA